MIPRPISVVATLWLLAIACTDDAPVPAPGVDPLPKSDGGPPPKSECDFAADCPAAPPELAHCSERKCRDGKCILSTLDKDQDGYTASEPCAPKSDGGAAAGDSTRVTTGEDCDDNNANLYPGHETTCTELPDGRPIMFPGGVPKGICQAGKKSCTADHKVSPCMNAVPPKTEDCNTLGADEDCDGSNVNGCACTGTSSVPCGSTVGACKAGTQTCASGVYGACVGAVGPTTDDCSAVGADNNCDGIKGNGPTCTTVIRCLINFDWIRGPGCNGSKAMVNQPGYLPIYACSDGQTPATIYVAQSCPFAWEGYALVGYVSPVSGGAGWVALAGGYALQ